MGRLNIRFAFAIACPEAPLQRLSIADIIISRCVRISTTNPISQNIVPHTFRVSGSLLEGTIRIHG